MVEAHITEKGKQDSPVNSYAEENGTTNYIVQVPLNRRSSGCPEDGPSWNQLWCSKTKRGKWVIHERCFYWWIVSTMVTLLLMVLVIPFAVRRDEICPVLPPALLADPCPKGWVGYQRKCYYFSMTEGNWTSSSIHCSSHNASLAMIDSQEEMDFLLRYKSPPDHWIGLQRNSGQPWRWVNGSIFKDWLRIDGGRRCAYLASNVIASSGCMKEAHWICIKKMITGVAKAEPMISALHEH